MKHSGILRNEGQEESCANLRGPSREPKYSRETESERVLWREGGNSAGQVSEIVPETIRLQAVGASYDVTACLLHTDPTSDRHWRG